MKRCAPVRWTIVLVCTTAPLLLGCEAAAPPAPAAPIKVTPQESFAEIVRIVTKSLETGTDGMPSAKVWSDAGSRSQFVVNNKVTSDFIPPGEGSSEIRGTITVTSRSFYSFRHSPGAAKESAEEEDSKENQPNHFELPEDDADEFGSFNDGLITSPTKKDSAPPTKSSERVDFRENESVRIFRLAYEDGRWVLKTKPDAETEQAVRKAFEFALERQL